MSLMNTGVESRIVNALQGKVQCVEKEIRRWEEVAIRCVLCMQERLYMESKTMNESISNQENSYCPSLSWIDSAILACWEYGLRTTT